MPKLKMALLPHYGSSRASVPAFGHFGPSVIVWRSGMLRCFIGLYSYLQKDVEVVVSQLLDEDTLILRLFQE